MKTAIITAATKGMGKAIATAFAKEGVNLAICSRTGDDLEAFKAELLTVNPSIKIYTSVTDCSDKEQVKAFAAAAEKELGAISIIVNNVGIYIWQSILDEDENVFEKSVNINLGAAYELYRYFGKKMI